MKSTISKKHIVTIAGRPGSGKSTTAKAVAARLGYQHFSSGDLFRAIAKEQGVDVRQANLNAESNSTIDNLVDQRLQDIDEHQDKIVIDSRLAWHWMPHSFKVYLDLDLEVAASRILQDIDPARLVHEHIPADAALYAAELQGRLDSEARRYKRLYAVDPYDHANFDLIVDTHENDQARVVKIILDQFHEWLAN